MPAKFGQDVPDQFQLVTEDRHVTPSWNQWFQRAQNVVVAVNASGPTSERPKKVLWVGRPFFDTTLGRPVYVKSVNPAVWVDGTGAVV